MNQKSYSDYILNGLIKVFPSFINCYSYTNEIVNIDFWSNKGFLKLWITTYNMEVTIGFEGKEPKFDWHTHMSLFGAYNPDDELREAINLIQDIILGEYSIAFDINEGYSLVEESDTEITENKFQIFKWSEL